MKKLVDFLYHRSMRIGREKIPFFYGVAYRYRTIAKFIFSGGSAAVIQLGVLYILTEFFDVWYVLSSAIAFIFAFVVAFHLHKFWTFRNEEKNNLKDQLFYYFALALFNLGLNSLLMFMLVDYAGLWYMVSQIITGAGVAFWSFAIQRAFIFKNPHTQT